MQALALLRIQAHANRLANHRLHTARAPLEGPALHAPRTGFFPSLMATLNHILGVDGYCVGTLHGDADLVRAWERFVPATRLADLAERQRRRHSSTSSSCPASRTCARPRWRRWAGTKPRSTARACSIRGPRLTFT